MQQRINTGLALILIWSVGLAGAIAIIFSISKTDFSYIYVDSGTGITASTTAGN